MWGFQHMFRSSVDISAKYALRSIGAGVDPVAALVGFRATDQARFEHCIEPENEPIGLADLSQVTARARALYEVHEDFNTHFGHPDHQNARHRALQDQLRGQALCEALAQSEAGQGRRFFASRPQQVGDYYVYAVIGVVAHRWDELPSLMTRRRERRDVTPSLAEAVINEVLGRASQAMSRQVPPNGVADESGSQTADIVRGAAHRFLSDIAHLSDQWMGSQLHEHLDAVAALPYEGRASSGTIVLAANNEQTRTQDVEVAVAFQRPVRISETRAFRKVIEMSADSLHVLCDGEYIYGLGKVRDTYDPMHERVFDLTVVSRGSWEVSHGQDVLLRVDNMHPRLPKAPLSENQFKDTVERLFPEATPVQFAALWDLATTAADQVHGTMLVVHRDAAGEAARLAPQALAIEPTTLEAEHLRAITNIDGAVLVSPDGACHAVGVILDGQATGDGDPARGARYNSAVRYRHAAGDDCLVIIVSEDGMIDLLPNLKPRIDAARVDAAVRAVEAAADGQVNFERFHRARDHLETMAFYLNSEQCERANAATAKVETYREANTPSHMRINHSVFSPSPGMNDTFFLPG